MEIFIRNLKCSENINLVGIMVTHGELKQIQTEKQAHCSGLIIFRFLGGKSRRVM